MKIMFILLFSIVIQANEAINLEEALLLLKENNLEIKSAKLDIKSSSTQVDKVSGSNWGKLEFIQDFANSDDAGNIFGFKLTSREASFGDFGLSEFDPTNPNLLKIQPKDLNYPDSRNFFQSKLKYEVPLFTGFKISSYTDIMRSMTKIKSLQKDAMINEKTYELKKSFYDMALLKKSQELLTVILNNIMTLENTTQTMIEVGYAKKVDLLEVKAKKGNIQRLISEMKSNQKLLYHYISFLLNEKTTNIITPSLEVAMPHYTDEEILNSNLDIKQAEQGLHVREDMIDVSQSAYYPTLGAFGEISTADDTFLGDASDHSAYTVGARLTWNIFNGGSDSADIEKSRIEHLKTKNQVALAKSGIALKVQKIRTQIKTYDEDIISLEKELALANEIYKNYEGRYKEKLSSMSDVIIKQSSQIQKILELQLAHNKRNERIFALQNLANGDK